MNGKSDIDPINPSMRECDKHTYGCRWLNIMFYGRRLFCLRVLGVSIDIFWTSWRCWRPMYTRFKNAACVSGLFGCVTWPMPVKTKEKR